MLYEQELEELIFNRHEIIEKSDELVVLSGYLGPKPVERLKELPFKSTVIYGMYGDKGIQNKLHNSLLHHQNNIDNLNIFYSNIPIHSKCYIWKYKNKVKHALIGSANFSINGLTTPYREVLAETTNDTFTPLNAYIDRIMKHSTICTDITLPKDITTGGTQLLSICQISLLEGNKNKVHLKSGLNWGQGNAHNKPNDSCLVIKKEHIRGYPYLFPPIQNYNPVAIAGSRKQRKNDKVEIIWDDGVVMNGLLEGSQFENGLKYPNKFSSFPSKSIMGKYLRYRLNVSSGQAITIEDLNRYGRTDINISLQDEGIYYFDFSNSAITT